MMRRVRSRHDRADGHALDRGARGGACGSLVRARPGAATPCGTSYRGHGDGAVPPDRRVVASARVARLAAREWCGRCVAVVGVEHGSTGPGATIARQRTVVRRVDQRGVAAEASGPCGARRNVAVWGWVGVAYPVGRPGT